MEEQGVGRTDEVIDRQLDTTVTTPSAGVCTLP